MDVSSLLERANLLLEQGRYKDAEKHIKQVLEQEPENDYALSVLSRCYINNGQYDQGIEAIQQAIAIDPEESFYYYLLGFGHYHKDLPEAAISHVKKAIELFPYNSDYFGLLASIHLGEKNYEKALETANEGLAIDPENISCLNIRSRSLNKLKRTDEAVDTMENTLSKDPDNEYTHVTVGWNYLEKGNHKKANQHFREALRIDPNFESARIGLKESLKSNFLPYKLVFQFSLWMSEKSKNFRWIFFIGIYLIIRLFSTVAKNNEPLKPFLLPVVVLYFLFIFFTWIANPLANFSLLFHRDGKYSITKGESIIGISVVSALVSGIALSCYAYYFFLTPPNAILYPAIILATMAIPLGQLELPFNLKPASGRVWYPVALIITGLLSIPLFFISSETAFFLTVAYGLGLLIYTWVATSWN
jgi:tetratricopeptide (TPR) repeat protein